MKRISTLLIAAVGLLFCKTIEGQTSFGIKGGVNIANITGNEYKARISGHAGVFANRMINKYFAVQPELLFSGEGQIADWIGAEHTTAINYIQFPLMFQVYPVQQVYIEAGPQVGLLISAKGKTQPSNASHTNVETKFPSAQFGIGVGLGVKPIDRLIVYGRYNFGLTDLTLDDPGVHRGRVAQIGIAIRLCQ